MNILIVDDDALIRNWLTMLLSQLTQYKLTVYEACDGIDALEACRDHTIDFVITDIRMPRLNGIDLIRQLSTEYPHIRTAVLSSYDDFSYVRIALKCGALDYILKAEMNMQDVSSLLDKVNSSITLEANLLNNSDHHHSRISRTQKSFRKYYTSQNSASDDFFESSGESIVLDNLCITLMKVQSSQDSGPTPFTIAGICTDSIASASLDGIAFPWKDDLFILMYNFSDSIIEHQNEQHVRLLSYIDKNLENFASSTIEHSINVVCKDGDNLQDRFSLTCELMDYRIYYRVAGETSLSDICRNDNGNELVRAIQSALDVGDFLKAPQLFKNYIHSAHKEKSLPASIKKTAATAMHLMISYIQEDADFLEGFMKKTAIATSAYQLQNYIDQFCICYIRYSQAQQKIISPAIKLAMAYINNNYNKKIILDEVAVHVALNRSYLSLLFKKETGIQFGDYIEQIRIKNAQNLLRTTNKSVSEVAEFVGFSNQNYFTKVFKKATGVSPMKYKKQA